MSILLLFFFLIGIIDGERKRVRRTFKASAFFSVTRFEL